MNFTERVAEKEKSPFGHSEPTFSGKAQKGILCVPFFARYFYGHASFLCYRGLSGTPNALVSTDRTKITRREFAAMAFWILATLAAGVLVVLYFFGFLSSQPKPPKPKNGWWGRGPDEHAEDESIREFKVCAYSMFSTFLFCERGTSLTVNGVGTICSAQ